MKTYIVLIGLLFSLCITAPSCYAQMGDDNGDDGVGQTIQIYTRFHTFIGKPTWLLVIRDLDHNQNIPYLFDVKRGDNFWVAFTYGRNYLITTSRLQIVTYRPKDNTFRQFRIKNFCNFESNGRIIRGKSLYITINGDLTPNSDDYTCSLSSYSDSNFTIVSPVP